MNQLSDHLSATETSSERQSTLDAHIRSRIRAEIDHLRREEEEVQHEIEVALEKENLDRARSMVGEASQESDDASGTVKNSAALLGDLEEIRTKVDKYHAKKELAEFPTVKAGGEAVVACYRLVFDFYGAASFHCDVG